MKRISLLAMSMVVLLAFSCKKDDKSGSTTVTGTKVTVQLKKVPGLAKSKAAWIFTMYKGTIETSGKGVAYNDSLVSAVAPNRDVYDVMVYVSNDVAWTPSQAFSEGWFCLIQEVDGKEYYKRTEDWSYCDTIFIPSDVQNKGLLGNLVACDITAPADSSDYEDGDIVNIAASSADNEDGYIKSVKFLVDGNEVATLLAPDYKCQWNTKGQASGYHKVKVIATNNNGYTNTDEILIKINKNVGATPDASFSGLDSVYTAGDSVTVAVIASDDKKISKVVIEIEGKKTEEKTKAPYTITWAAEVGSYLVRATAYDEDGNVRTIMQNIKVKEAVAAAQ